MPGEQHDPSSGPHDPTVGPHDPASAPLRLRTPTDLLAALPYLVHQPLDDAVVALVLRQESLLGVLYGGLDHLDHVLTPDRSGRAAVDAALGEGDGALLVAGFGHSARITPHVRALLREARARGLPVLEALRVTGDRYWSYLCRDPDCCPAEGRRFDPDASPVPAGAVVRGLVPTVRDPSARVGFLLEPVHAPVRSEVAEEAAAEEERLGGADQVARHTAVVLGILREEARHRVTAPAVLARLGVHLTRVPVRDAVWTRITPDTAALHVRLWSRVVRHVPDRHRPAPAALLAVAAWQHDDLDLARAAVESALEAEPGYAMAVLMARALETGLPAERWRGFLATRTDDGDVPEDPERIHGWTRGHRRVRRPPRRPYSWSPVLGTSGGCVPPPSLTSIAQVGCGSVRGVVRPRALRLAPSRAGDPNAGCREPWHGICRRPGVSSRVSRAPGTRVW